MTDLDYDTQSNPASVIDRRSSATLNGNPKTLASSITYLPYGGITGLTYGNSLSLSRGYDNQYRTSSIAVGSLLASTYGYDANGNVTSFDDGEAAGNEALETAGIYSYDQGANLLAGILGEVQFVYEYDYNANTVSANNRTFVYDSSNQLIQVLDNSNLIAEYVYNGAGQRIKKWTSSGTRIFHYDPKGHPIAETNQSGTMLAEYVYLGDQVLAMIKPGENVYYFHNDHLGTPQVLTNDSQTVVWKAAYTPFGQADITVGTVENNLRFPGQYYDAETGLHYNYFRYYDPTTGRYVTPDPIGLEGGINLFTYVANNPLNLIDSVGLYEQDVHFEKTFEWAVKEAGIEPRIAMRIASANQSLDDAAFTKPESSLSWISLGITLHFQTRDYAQRGLAQALSQGNIRQFGIFLHILQDSFSHEGINPFEHIYISLTGDTSPDQYCEGTFRDKKMKELTLWWLKEFERNIGKKYHPKIGKGK